MRLTVLPLARARAVAQARARAGKWSYESQTILGWQKPERREKIRVEIRATFPAAARMSQFQRLTDCEKKAIREALHAMAYGPFIEDWELPLRCHVDRAGYQAIVNRWPDLDDTRPDSDSQIDTSVYYAINGALNICCHAYEMEAEPWEQWFTVTPEQLLTVYQRWRTLHRESQSST